MKIIYLIIGITATALGGIGVILPVLPTTPFLLLAAFCFAKSSKRFYWWFVNTALYQKHLDSFIRHRAMTRKTKVTLLCFASTMLLLAMVFMDNLYLRIFLLCLMIFKYYYFLVRIETIEEATTSS